MKIVIDVNRILSALIRDSSTRKIILNSEFDFYFPEPSLHKIRKYKSYIFKKSGLTEEEYDKIIVTLFKYIKLVPTEEIEKNWNEAKKIMEHIDPEDVVFIATALSISDLVIWSDDRHFEKQDKIKVLNTKEVVKLFFP